VPIREAFENNVKLGSTAFPVGTPNQIFILFLLASEMRQAKQMCLSCDKQREGMEEKIKRIKYSTFILISAEHWGEYWKSCIAFDCYLTNAMLES
jgi:hypothetical protein